MADSALIDTSNRLLGWSTNDFSLYGGQAAVTIGAPATLARGSDGLSVPDPAHSAGAQSAQLHASPPGDQGTQAFDESHIATSAYHFTPFAPAPIQFGSPAQAQSFEAQVPTAVGSGGPVLPLVDALHAPAIMPAAPPAGLTTPTLTIDHAEAAAPALAALGGLAAPVLGLNQTIDQAVSTVDHVLSTVTASTDTLLGDAPHLVDALSLSDIVATDDFLGSDPVGGVATLVSMVDSTDAFDLAHAGLDIPEVAAAGSILDTLADEAVAGPLLGDVEHSVDTVLPDHHDDGVLGFL